MNRHRLGWLLLVGTAVLCVSGMGLYLAGNVGWAQFFWVMASGTAGGSVMALLGE